MKYFFLFCLSLPLFALGQPAEHVSLRAEIRGLEKAQGKVAILLCDEQGNEVGQYWLFVKSNEVLLEVDDLSPGMYALKFFHDENNNGTLDQNLIGIPTESFGFSNDAKVILGMPSLESMLFSVDGPTSIVMNAKRI